MRLARRRFLKVKKKPRDGSSRRGTGSSVDFTKTPLGTSLVVEWLQFCPSNAGGMGSIPSGVGTHMQPSPSTATTEAGSGAHVPQQAKPAHLSQREATASHS